MWIESGKSCTFAKTFRNMRVLIINTSEKTGGAAIAARRLMESLHTAGTDVKMLVLHKESQSKQVIPVGKDWQKKCTFLWERLVIWTNNLFSRKNLFTVSIANTGFNVTKLPAFREADIIHLHWINQGMLSLNNIQEIFESGKPVVWTLHDLPPCPYLHPLQKRMQKLPLPALPRQQRSGAPDIQEETKTIQSCQPPEYRRSQHMAFLTNTAKHPT